jgi:hypothetical protein
MRGEDPKIYGILMKKIRGIVGDTPVLFLVDDPGKAFAFFWGVT